MSEATLGESSFRLQGGGASYCLLSGAICVYQEGNKVKTESGDCRRCVLPLIMTKDAISITESRRRRNPILTPPQQKDI